jgi:hypothetical protein
MPGEVALADVLRLPELFEVLERPPSGQGAARPGGPSRRCVRFSASAGEGRHVQRDMRQRAATLATLAGRIRHHLPELQRCGGAWRSA